MPIPAGHKFACLALPISSQLAEGIELRLTDEILVATSAPHAIEDHWKTWLGTLLFERYEESDAFLIAHRASERLDVSDHEQRDLSIAVRVLWDVLLLTAIPHHGEDYGLVVTGAMREAGAKANSVAPLPLPFWAQWGPAPALDDLVLRASVERFERVRWLWGTPPNEYARLKRGLHAFRLGASESDALERLHQFVRALDGVLKLPPGPNKFAERANTFSLAAPEVLDQIYRLRNAAEHLKDWRAVFAGVTGDATNMLGDTRAYQAERLAGHALGMVLDSPALVGAMQSDASIDAFWRRPAADVEADWGTKVDLDAVGASMDFTHYHDVIGDLGP